jgi:hypothetical protein
LKQLPLDGDGAAGFDKHTNTVWVGAGYDHVELNKQEVAKLIAFLAKALARMK